MKRLPSAALVLGLIFPLGGGMLGSARATDVDIAALDSDGDGFPDFLEYALGSDPFKPDALRVNFDWAADGKSSYPGIRFNRPSTGTGNVGYELLAADTPAGPWTVVPSILEPIEADPGIVILRQSLPRSETRGFFRLRVSQLESEPLPLLGEFHIQGPVMMGETVTVGKVAWATESLPIQYQWLLNGIPIIGETRPSLVVPDTSGVLSCRISAPATAGSTVVETPAVNLPQAPFSSLWQLDATQDFPAMPDGGKIAKWIGKGIGSEVQGAADSRPTYTRHAVMFDGNDFLSFPMWQGGIGKAWTLAVLAKFDNRAIADYQALWGATSNRALETFYFKNGLGLITQGSWESFVAHSGFGLLLPNDNWRKIIMTSDGTTVQCWIDGVSQTTQTTATIAASLIGSFRVGKAQDVSSPAPFSMRWMGFYPAVLNRTQVRAMENYLDGLKEGEAPPTTVFIEGGQSNHQVSHATTSGMRAAAFTNPSFAVDAGTGGTPLYYWWRFANNDSGQGMEVCPAIDVSAAPAGTVASQMAGKFRGQATLDAWQTALSGISTNPRSQVFVHWTEGETATGDSRYTWLPNTSGNWTLAMSDPYQNADDYGTLAAGWNAHIRETYSIGNAFFIYHFVSFPDALHPGDIQDEAITRRNWNLRQAMRGDSRWLANDITDFEREPDNIHLTSTATKPASSPNTGSECFGRAQVRIDRAAEHLATLGYDARMLAMRAIDVGYDLTDAQMDACETFVASPGFKHLYSLVIPVLTAANVSFDQPRARRCNLLVHARDRYNLKFETSVPLHTTVRCTEAGDTGVIRAAVETLLGAWNLRDQVTVQRDVPAVK